MPAEPQVQTDNSQQILGLTRLLIKAGIPLSKILEIPEITQGLGGISGTLGLIQALQQGNIPGAVGNASTLAATLANAGGLPQVASGVGAIGGPLTLATGLAQGNPLQSALGGVQTASMASGALGGPTLGSLTSEGLAALYNTLPGATAAGADALGIGGAGAAASGEAAGAGAGIAGMVPMLAAAPVAIALGGALYSLMNKHAEHALAQTNEYRDYAQDFPGLAQRRIAGASLFDTLGQNRTPDELQSAFQTAASGMHANTEPAAYNLSHRPSATKIQPMDLSAWEKASPTLGGENAAAFLNLFDKSEGAGLDPGGQTGDWNLNPAGFASAGERQKGVTLPDDTNRTGNEYRTKLGYNNQAQFEDVLDPGGNIIEKKWVGGDKGQTQEAQDLGNAIAGLGQTLGVNWDRGDGRDYGNFDPEQLAGYGFTPGNYGPAALNYLRSFDPGVTQNPNWAPLTQALGDPSLLGLLNVTGRDRPTYAAPPVLSDNVGGE